MGDSSDHLLSFHVTAFARPAGVGAGAAVSLRGASLATLAIQPAELCRSFDCSFEEAAHAIGALPRMFIEPDGSFVWVAERGGKPWQVDGQLHDRAGRLLAVDMKGTCTVEAWRGLLSRLGWPQMPLAIELVREGIFLAPEEFERYAARPSAG